MTKPSRKQQSEQTKIRILTAVKEVLSEKDMNNIKIRDICQRAHVSIGTFYLYFSCKEEAILYDYRDADESFEELKMTKNIKKNILLILKTYYEMVHLEDLPYCRHLYICHLTYFDSYFFDENRTLFSMLNRQIQLLSNISDTKEITWKVLEYARGRIYNLCIRFDKDTHNWHKTQVNETWEYLEFLINRVENKAD